MKHRILKVTICMILAAVMVINAGGCGMFGRSYTIGSDIKFEDIYMISTSYGSSVAGNEYDFSAINGEKEGLYISAMYYKDGERLEYNAPINEYDWRNMCDIIDGNKLVKDKTDYSVMDGESSSVRISWKEGKGGYHVELDSGSQAELTGIMRDLAEMNGPLYPDELTCVSSYESGDSSGTYYYLEIEYDGEKWFIHYGECLMYGEPEIEALKEVSDEYITRMREVIKKYNFEGWDGMPQSEEQALDAGVRHLQLIFDNIRWWGIDNTQELPDKAYKMEDELIQILEEAKAELKEEDYHTVESDDEEDE